jgi:hypothetical protein
MSTSLLTLRCQVIARITWMQWVRWRSYDEKNIGLRLAAHCVVHVTRHNKLPEQETSSSSYAITPWRHSFPPYKNFRSHHQSKCSTRDRVIYLPLVRTSTRIRLDSHFYQLWQLSRLQFTNHYTSHCTNTVSKIADKYNDFVWTSLGRGCHSASYF